MCFKIKVLPVLYKRNHGFVYLMLLLVVRILSTALNIPLMQGGFEEVPTVHFHYLANQVRLLLLFSLHIKIKIIIIPSTHITCTKRL